MSQSAGRPPCSLSDPLTEKPSLLIGVATVAIIFVVSSVVLGAWRYSYRRWLLDRDVRRERLRLSACTPLASSSRHCELSTSTLLP